jgi:hypothetical protein
VFNDCDSWDYADRVEDAEGREWSYGDTPDEAGTDRRPAWAPENYGADMGRCPFNALNRIYSWGHGGAVCHVCKWGFEK